MNHERSSHYILYCALRVRLTTISHHFFLVTHLTALWFFLESKVSNPSAVDLARKFDRIC